MEDVMNTSLYGSFNNSSATFSYCYLTVADLTWCVLTYIIVSIGLPLTLVAIYSLYLLVQDDHVAPIYVINLLIADLIQLCCMTVLLAADRHQIVSLIFSYIYTYIVGVSIGFMVCVAMERYLVIAHPLWYRCRRTIKSSVVISVVVWVLPIFFLWFQSGIALFLLLPFPFFIFFLVRTVKVLFASVSVPSDEKRRIVGTLVLVLLIYTLLFLPILISMLAERIQHLFSPVSLPVLLSPLADLLLYVFMKKGIIDKFLASVCCCRMDSNDIRRADSNDVSTIDNNDIHRMDSYDISRTESSDISTT
ncbi:G-protein coupled receptor 4-like [Acanthopagrus latus]|uniref:G-protein coupled receptor 4-like n=1 Tax=Acanthopagrus latus TaxID=8177 RepID=UPI00187C1477|nr:G-protein coupled receptor 4-like [Acanthopagrus latus]XP_036976799.1 G-protein coupled receptor 4-like [Acanthopagrus latus]